MAHTVWRKTHHLETSETPVGVIRLMRVTEWQVRGHRVTSYRVKRHSVTGHRAARQGSEVTAVRQLSTCCV